jgi:HK97 family phage major capsid protein
MSLLATLKDKLRDRKKVLDQAGEILTKAHKEKRSLTAEENTEFETRHADGDKMLKEIEQLQKQLDAEKGLAEIPSDRRSAGREDTDPEGDVEVPAEKRKEAEKRALRKWMQGGMAALNADEVRALEKRNAALDPEGPRPVRRLRQRHAGAYTVPAGAPVRAGDRA